jgi:integrating conjugative element protein (TIGR03756 family)
VIAQRAGDIVTRSDQPHIYVATEQGIVTRAGYRVWMPPPLVEADEETGTWQMLVPIEENECKVFGENDVFALPGNAWADGKLDFSKLPLTDEQDSHGGDYVWNLWRPYQCCRDRGTFITDIDF